MNPINSWVGRGLALLVVGGALFYVAWPRSDEPPTPSAEPAASAKALGEQADDLAELRSQVGRLQADVLALHSRVDKLALARQAPDGGVASGGTSPGMIAWQEALRRMREGGGEGRNRGPGARRGSFGGDGSGDQRAFGADGEGRSGQGAQRREARFEQFATRANLSQGQTESVRAALDAERERMKAMREQARSGGGDRRSMRDEMQKLRSETDAQLKSVLDEGQYSEYEQLRTERPQRGQQAQRGGSMGGGATRGGATRGGGFGPRRAR